ncbi:DUF11 domain-containing protein [Nonomuraea dietziae]|uniref:DUF11 domain-containing protein n=2 Tax=Nonomuraea dietziae TaxID=65515 RepID=UPI00332687FD
MRWLARSLVALVVVMAYLAPTAAQAENVKVTVHLYRVVEVECGEGEGESCGNDYYPRFLIDGQGFGADKDDFCCAHGPDFRTNWSRTVTVNPDHNPIDIHLELWDQDDLTPDDPIDWGAPGDDLDITFDLNTCIFTGGDLTAQQGAGILSLTGQSEASGVDSARGYFTITTDHCLAEAKKASRDSDGDGLQDSWEIPGLGLDANTDGTVDLPLGNPPYNALPYRKDLFVEVDYLKGFRPDYLGLLDVVDAFDRAPVDRYHGGTYLGVRLHILDIDEELPHVPVLRFIPGNDGQPDNFSFIKNGAPNSTCAGAFGTAADRSSPNCVNILKAKSMVYRYMIFGDRVEDKNRRTDGSGLAEWEPTSPRGGNDFVVTMGVFTPKELQNLGGRANAEKSTFMHELGHTLGLGHGGDEEINCKPNYLSVMNYSYQFQDYDRIRPLDYSSAASGTALGVPLQENHLNENVGVYASPDRQVVYGVDGKPRTVTATSGFIDWNGNGTRQGDTPANINRILKECPDQALQALHGFDDWANIQYNPRLNAGFFADGARRDLPQELTAEMIRARFQKSDLKLTKSADQTEAVGGDTLTYTVTVTDLGPGAAGAVSLTDTLPDGTTHHRSLPDLANGAVHTVTPEFTYQVPCATTDGAVLTNTATVTGKDSDGTPDPYTDDNTDRATTTIRAPALTVKQTATPTVNAGEAVSYTVTYANTGGGAASDTVVTATLPSGLYYSKVLDLGTGPRPGSVTLNADGTRTLVWNVGDTPAESGDREIVFTARPTLLAPAGTTYPSQVSVNYKNAGGACVFAPVTATATTTVTAVPPTRDPLSKGFWKNHAGQWTAEVLARVQATDQRYDSDRSGALNTAEVTTAFRGDNAPKSVLTEHLLGTYFNLATRRVNADTTISSSPGTVRAAVLYAQVTTDLPVDSGTAERYSRSIRLLDDINANRIEVY